MNSKPTVNKDLEDLTLQDPAGEGASPSAKCLVQKPIKKKKRHKVLTPEQQARRATLKKALTWLNETFPNCFNLSTPKPLKRQIAADIFSHLPEDQSVSRRSIRTVLTFYVNRKAYHQALLENNHRFNLEGNSVEAIELAHQEHARTALECKAQMKAARQANKEKNREIIQESQK